MLGRTMIKKLLAASVMCTVAVAVQADVRLPNIFGNNMVLQRDIKVPVWGQAASGEKVTVSIAGKTGDTVADKKGRWKLQLGPFAADGRTYEMTVSGDNMVKFKNVLFGEVWICSGQSNMVRQIKPKDAEKANFPSIRLFTVNRRAATTPQFNCGGNWNVCAPNTVKHFSAAAYFFGRELFQNLKIPIGLINVCYSGTVAATWTPREALDGHPKLRPILERFDAAMACYSETLAKYEKDAPEWWNDFFPHDANCQELKSGWNKTGFNDESWQTTFLPAMWAKKPSEPRGTVWYRKKVKLPKAWIGKKLVLGLGKIDDFDITYFNGVRVGTVDYETQNARCVRRHYKIPAELVKAGQATIAVQMISDNAYGGFNGPKNDMFLRHGKDKISLAGEWKYSPGTQRAVKAHQGLMARRPKKPWGPNHFQGPSRCFNAMINPLVPYGIRGTIWYQGESNISRGYQYRYLLPAMITEWRKRWRQGDFPFLFVQLAKCWKAKKQPSEGKIAELRESQLMTLKIPNTGMAVAIDTGLQHDFHPDNAPIVGPRLALAALKKAYSKNIVYSGPIYDSMKIEGSKITIKFKNIGSGMVVKGGGKLNHFAIAGKDKKFVWANAVINGDNIVVSNDQVAKPVAVRYAWANFPDGCNLYNREGLPASPFRTDSWPGLTDNCQSIHY